MVLIIEIGTNSIKSLLATSEKDGWKIISEHIYTTRIGEHLSKKPYLSEIAIQRNINVLAEILSIAHKHINIQIHMFSTEALRKAVNKDDFVSTLEHTFRIPIKVLTKEEEARLAFLGATNDMESFAGNCTVIDIGGGSTEFILGKKDDIKYAYSISIGALTATELFLPNIPVELSQIEDLRQHLRKELPSLQNQMMNAKLLGVGGTITTLAMLNNVNKETGKIVPIDNIQMIDGFVLSLEVVESFINNIRMMFLSERESLINMPKDRADIILAGAVILDELMQRLEQETITVSVRGVRYGYLYTYCNPK